MYVCDNLRKKIIELKFEEKILSLVKFNYKKTEYKEVDLSFHYFRNDADK